MCVAVNVYDITAGSSLKYVHVTLNYHNRTTYLHGWHQCAERAAHVHHLYHWQQQPPVQSLHPKRKK